MASQQGTFGLLYLMKKVTKGLKLMVEIINGDPLSGLLVTLGFFVSLIVGRYVRMRQVSRRREETR